MFLSSCYFFNASWLVCFPSVLQSTRLSHLLFQKQQHLRNCWRGRAARARLIRSQMNILGLALIDHGAVTGELRLSDQKNHLNSLLVETSFNVEGTFCNFVLVFSTTASKLLWASDNYELQLLPLCYFAKSKQTNECMIRLARYQFKYLPGADGPPRPLYRAWHRRCRATRSESPKSRRALSRAQTPRTFCGCPSTWCLRARLKLQNNQPTDRPLVARDARDATLLLSHATHSLSLSRCFGLGSLSRRWHLFCRFSPILYPNVCVCCVFGGLLLFFRTWEITWSCRPLPRDLRRKGSVEKNGNFQVAKLCARGLNNVVDLWSWLWRGWPCVQAL